MKYRPIWVSVQMKGRIDSEKFLEFTIEFVVCYRTIAAAPRLLLYECLSTGNAKKLGREVDTAFAYAPPRPVGLKRLTVLTKNLVKRSVFPQ